MSHYTEYQEFFFIDIQKTFDSTIVQLSSFCLLHFL